MSQWQLVVTMTLDSLHTERAFGDDSLWAPQPSSANADPIAVKAMLSHPRPAAGVDEIGEVWATSTTLSGCKFAVVMGANVAADRHVSHADLGLAPGKHVAHEANTTSLT